jgi:hypothetical protein
MRLAHVARCANSGVLRAGNAHRKWPLGAGTSAEAGAVVVAAATGDYFAERRGDARAGVDPWCDCVAGRSPRRRFHLHLVGDDRALVTSYSSIRAAGHFVATRAGVMAGDATLWMETATAGTLSFGGQAWAITGDPTAKTLRGTARGLTVALTIVTRNRLSGTLNVVSLTLARTVLRPIPPDELAQSDSGLTGAIRAIMDATPDYQPQVGYNQTSGTRSGPCCTGDGWMGAVHW